MVNIKLTFIPSDGGNARDYMLENFDLAGISGLSLKTLLSEKVGVPPCTYLTTFFTSYFTHFHPRRAQILALERRKCVIVWFSQVRVDWRFAALRSFNSGYSGRLRDRQAPWEHVGPHKTVKWGAYTSSPRQFGKSSSGSNGLGASPAPPLQRSSLFRSFITT